MNKRLCLLVMACAVAIFASGCRHSVDESTKIDDNVSPVTKEKVLEKIEILNPKTSYQINESFTTQGMVVKVTFDDGSSSNEIDFTAAGWSIDSSKFDSSAISSGQEITVSYTYKGVTKSASFTVIIYDPDAIKSIAVKENTAPAHAKGASDFNWQGLVVEMTLDDGSDTVVSVSDFSDTSKWTFTGFDATNVNAALPMAVTYHKSVSEEFTANFTISIYDPDAVKAIAIKAGTGPFIDTYDCKADESEFKWQGLVVEMTLDDGNDTVVSVSDFSSTKWAFSGWNSDTPTDTLTMTITYNGDTALSDTFIIKIKDVVTGISINTEPSQKNYMIGEALDLTGLKVYVNYASGTQEPYDSSIGSSSDWEIIGFNTGNPTDNLPITIRYSVEGTKKGEATFDIAVYNIDSVTVPDELKTTAITTFFDGESEEFFRSEFVKDANKITVGLLAETKTTSREFSLTDSLVSVSLDGNGFDSTLKKFVESTGAGSDSAVTKISITLNSITQEASVPLTVRSIFKFSDDIQKLTKPIQIKTTRLLDIKETLTNSGGPENFEYNGIGNEVYTASFVEYGYYPQTLKENNVTVYHTSGRILHRGGFEMHLADDGCYYVSCVVKPFASGDQYVFYNNEKLSDSKYKDSEHWFKVEPIVWRVLDNNYNSSGGALLWSVFSLDRIAFYDDGVDTASGEGGKNERQNTVTSEAIPWISYKFSTVRAFLRGEYEEGDPELQQFDPYQRVESGKGFLQRAFTTNNLLKPVTLTDVDTTDCIFLLSVTELSTSAPSYYFIEESASSGDASYRQAQCTKQLSDYALARGGKRWSTNAMNSGAGSEFASYPGCEWWTRTSSSSSVRMVAGTGRVFGSNNIEVGRGAYPACSLVPAICVDASALPTP